MRCRDNLFIMIFVVRVEPDNNIFFVNPHETILDAALRQGFDFPYGCQEGTCGTCIAGLVEGSVSYPYAEPESLTTADMAEGSILLCSAVPRSDLVIRHNGMNPPWQRIRKTCFYDVLHVSTLSQHMVKIILSPSTDAVIHYQAGQYIEVYIENGESRPFSIANAPDGGKEIELHIKANGENAFITQLLNTVAVDKKLRIEGPFGRTIFRAGLPFPLILLAGGTGFSHSKALIEEVIKTAPQTPIHLFWGAKTPADLYLHTLPLTWEKTLPAFQYTPYISTLNKAHRPSSLITAVTDLYPQMDKVCVYASGPTNLVLDALKTFEQHQLKRALFFSDVFDYLPAPP